MKLEEFDISQELAKGSFGIVFKAVRKADGRVFALKQVKLEGMKRADREEAIDEARVLAQLNHPHVIKHYDSFVDKEKNILNIVMELASRGSLSQIIKENKAKGGKGLAEDLVWRYLIQSLLGLSHIHGKKIIHRDIKALNLFLDSQNNIKIGDLGIARALNDGSIFAHSKVGTPYYYSPELCDDKPYNEKSDIWALGVVIYECCTGTFPFDAKNEGALIRKIMLGQYPPISGPYSSALIQLINSMLTMKPIQRPDTNALLRNPNLMAKAKVLKVDMNPRVVGNTEDIPTYESKVDQGPPLPSYPQSQPPYEARPQDSYRNYPPYNMNPNAPPPRGPAGITPSAHPFGQPQQQQPQGYQPISKPPVGPAAHPFALHPMNKDPWDVMANDLQKVILGQEEFNQLNQDRVAALRLNQELARRNEAKEALAPGYDMVPTPNRRLAPEGMPAAGRAMRGDARPPESSPFALHYTEHGAKQGGNNWGQDQPAPGWAATYTPPTHGRKRATDLMVTGPSLRGGGGGRPGSAAGGGYARANDDATTYISSTSYARPY